MILLKKILDFQRSVLEDMMTLFIIRELEQCFRKQLLFQIKEV